MIAVVIPCFRVKSQVESVIARIGLEVSHVFVVDDKCPESTGLHVEQNCKDPRVKVLFHEKNQGVGGATLTGFRAALSVGADIIVKVDGDGQIPPEKISSLIAPIQKGQADFAKGNRFYRPEYLQTMPIQRLLGNSTLSFMSKISSGYWSVMDPTNGFIAIHRKALELLPLDNVDKTYFFESEMLFRLSTIRAVVRDVPMPSYYGDEKSNLRILKIILPFLVKHKICFLKRIFYSYFLRDFNLASIQFLFSMVFIAAGVIFGSWHWYLSSLEGSLASSGTVMVATLPILLGFQLLLFAVNYDILSEPKHALHPQL